MMADDNSRISIVVSSLIAAVLIFALAQGSEAVESLMPVLQIVLGIGGLVVGGRYLLKYRHELRLEEIEAQRTVSADEMEQLRAAERVLELDDRTEQLRSQLPAEPAPGPKAEQQEA